MNGEINLSIADLTMKTLDTFELRLGLPENVLSDKEEYKKYLSMDISQLEKLDNKECANISYRLSQFSLYIQRSVNRQKALSRTLENKINSIIGPKINQYAGAWNMQRASAIADNDVTQQLNEQLIESQTKQDSLEYVSNGLKELANHMKNLQYVRRDNG